MRVVVAHSPESNLVSLRQALLGAGLNCSSEDCVPWDHLPVRLAQTDADLIVVRTDSGEEAHWQTLRQVTALTAAPIMAVGPVHNLDFSQAARRAGVSEFIDEANLRHALDDALARLASQNARGAFRRGRAIAVYAPLAGSGATTLAANLAAVLTRSDSPALLVELAHEMGDVALMLNLTPTYTLADVCARWQGLDMLSLQNSLTPYGTGLQVLPASSERTPNPHLHADSARRVAVLAKAAFANSVLALDARLTGVELEAMKLADSILLVVRPDVIGVRRAEATLEQLAEQNIAPEQVHMVVNRGGRRGQLSRKQIETALGRPLAALIDDDPTRVTRAVNRGQLVHEISRRSPVVRQLRKLAKRCTASTQKVRSTR